MMMMIKDRNQTTNGQILMSPIMTRPILKDPLMVETEPMEENQVFDEDNNSNNNKNGPDSSGQEGYPVTYWLDDYGPRPQVEIEVDCCEDEIDIHHEEYLYCNVCTKTFFDMDNFNAHWLTCGNNNVTYTLDERDMDHNNIISFPTNMNDNNNNNIKDQDSLNGVMDGTTEITPTSPPVKLNSCVSEDEDDGDHERLEELFLVKPDDDVVIDKNEHVDDKKIVSSSSSSFKDPSPTPNTIRTHRYLIPLTCFVNKSENNIRVTILPPGKFIVATPLPPYKNGQVPVPADKVLDTNKISIPESSSTSSSSSKSVNLNATTPASEQSNKKAQKGQLERSTVDKRRRKELTDAYENIRGLMPSIQTRKRRSRGELLGEAINCIQSLVQEENKLVQERYQLQIQNAGLAKQLLMHQQ